MRNYSDEIVKHIEGCWKSEVDERTEWNFVTSTLYGFGIVTTLGYNRIAPITLTGRMFCILYGLCGIPVTMITIANVGRYLNTFAKNCKQKVCLQNFVNKGMQKNSQMREKGVQLHSEAYDDFFK
ncbi:unnamed protein product [Gongylonema pulchrum]|uniref:Ion_trans_2 domain-containing protein n=1 Tax=Gongylonema pulchrum TaxID=637853 RepID=A0A183EM66_9BILA|nr:unnamed protein product [Gongylonema pulchrum]